MLEVEPTEQRHWPKRQQTSEAFADWLHHRYALVELPSVGPWYLVWSLIYVCLCVGVFLGVKVHVHWGSAGLQSACSTVWHWWSPGSDPWQYFAHSVWTTWPTSETVRVVAASHSNKTVTNSSSSSRQSCRLTDPDRTFNVQLMSFVHSLPSLTEPRSMLDIHRWKKKL